VGEYFARGKHVCRNRTGSPRRGSQKRGEKTPSDLKGIFNPKPKKPNREE